MSKSQPREVWFKIRIRFRISSELTVTLKRAKRS